MSGTNTRAISDFRARRLEAEAAFHIFRREYRSALGALSSLKNWQGDENVTSKVHSLVMEGLCHLELSEYSAASTVIQKIFEMVTASHVTPDDVIKMAEIFQSEERHSRAYILYYVACKLYITQKAIDAPKKVKSAFLEMQYMAEEMSNNSSDKAIVSTHIVPAIKILAEELVAMPDNGSHEKIEEKTWCYLYIALCYSYLNNNSQNLAMNKAGIDMMISKLGTNAEEYRLLGKLHNNAGVAYRDLGQTENAKASFKSAIRVYVRARDFDDEEAREKDIAQSERNLNNLS